METMVRFQEVFSHDGSLWFRTLDNEVLSVKALNDGVMVIDPMIGTNIQKTAAIVAGCFDEESNLNGLKAIEFDFNGVYISVNAKNAQVDTILKMFEDGWQKNCEEAEARRREYEKTPEYRAERAKALKIQRRREQVHQLVLDTDKSSEMEFKSFGMSSVQNRQKMRLATVNVLWITHVTGQSLCSTSKKNIMFL